MKLQRKLLSFLLTLGMMAMVIPISVGADNQGLVGAHIKDGQLLGYYGDGGDIVIPNTITMIGPEAFLNNDNVTSVTIPGSVSTIGYNAFEGCTELERIIFSNPTDGAQLTIRVNAFINCPKLYECEIPAVAKYVTANVFKGCTSMERITVHADNPYYFTDSQGVLFGPWVDEGVPQYSDPRLALIAYPCGKAPGGYNIPEQVAGREVNRVWASGFRMAKNLTSVTIPPSITILGGNAFEETGLTSIVIPSTVTTIDSYLLASCTSLTEVTLPEGMTALPTGFLMGATSLRKINFPSTITSIEMYSLANCTSLTSLILPDKLTSISLAAFQGSSNLQRVVIPPSVINFPGDSELGAYDPFADSPRSLIVYVQTDSAAERWAFMNVSKWGYAYESVANTSDLEAINPGEFYLIDTGKKIKVEGRFPIYASINCESVTFGEQYDTFAAYASQKKMAVHSVSLEPSSVVPPTGMSLSVGLADDFTKNAKLYTLLSGTVTSIGGAVISRTLTADIDSLGYFAVIDTEEGGAVDTEVTSVTLNKSSAEIAVGSLTQLSATVLPVTASNKSVTWVSSAESVATVSGNGVVTAISAGTAIITATSINGKSGSCTITVVNQAEPSGEDIQTDASFNVAQPDAGEITAAFSLKLSNASRIATIQLTFQTETSDLEITGKNGFTLIGGVRGEMSGDVYTGSAVLGYLTSDKSLFSTVSEKEVAFITVNTKNPTVKITALTIAGWDASETVQYGIVKSFSPTQATVIDDLIYDVNGDDVINILDITAAQLYYQANSNDTIWAQASKCDFNNDQVVDIADFIELWLNFTSL